MRLQPADEMRQLRPVGLERNTMRGQQFFQGQIGSAMHPVRQFLVEWAAGQGFGRVADAPALLRDAVARRCAVRGWAAWIDPLCAWLQDFLQMPLGASDETGFTLAGLPVAVNVGCHVTRHATKEL